VAGFEVNSDGRVSRSFGGGLGGSVGTEYSTDVNISVPDTVAGFSGFAEDIQDSFR
jgi:hypothetical protein